MGLQPILERIHYGQWELCRKRRHSVDADAWCKRALTLHLKLCADVWLAHTAKLPRFLANVGGLSLTIFYCITCETFSVVLISDTPPPAPRSDWKQKICFHSPPPPTWFQTAPLNYCQLSVLWYISHMVVDELLQALTFTVDFFQKSWL